ncbi:MAG TPA: DNA sulfur modification protein DndB [Allosphingosinicella sp.]|nr:DNA sulfur modification protein DndB [Allosphingosinicella sp.]
MSFVPPIPRINRFDRTYRGSFGQFRTKGSYPIEYLLTTFSIRDFEHLNTASEALDPDEANFDELIQRDLDKERVHKIAEQYLRAGQNRPIFFPPLIACVALTEGAEGGRRLKPRYEPTQKERHRDGPVDQLVRTYDVDGFQVKLHATTAEYSLRQILWEDGEQPYLDFAAELALNSQRAKLVVLDGQHRLKAIRLLMNTPENREIISRVELPVCIVWPPDAVVGEDESVVQDFRDLFVTINSKTQRVSGHFLILLNDNSFTAATVRDLAQAWKKEESAWSKLHLLEWNTRENERTDKRTRGFSVTTISIIAKALEDHLFDDPSNVSRLLNLSARAAEFERVDPEFIFEELGDRVRTPATNAIVREQIRSELLPALTTLFRELRPYAIQEQKLSDAFARAQTEATELSEAYVSLLGFLKRYEYTLEEQTGPTVRGAYEEFRRLARNAPEDDTYFLAVFQQAMTRAWLRIAAVLTGISAHEAAKATVRALNAFVVREPSRQHELFLSSQQPYVRRVLWKGEAVNFTAEWAKTAWLDILLASLLRPEVRDAALAEFSLNDSDRTAFSQSLAVEGLVAAQAYSSRLWEETLRETRNNLGDYFGETKAGQLRDLKTTKLQQFEREVSESAQIRFNAALSTLANRLGRRTQDLLRAP